MQTFHNDRPGKAADLTRLPNWMDAHIGRFSVWALCAVCAMPAVVILLSPLIASNDMLWLLQLVTYLAGMCGFCYLWIPVVRFLREQTPGGLRKRLNGRWMLVFFMAMLLWSALATAVSDNFWLCYLGDALWKEGLLTQFEYAGLLALGILLPPQYRRRVLDCLVAAAAFQALLCFLDAPWIMELTGMERSRAIYLNCNHYGYYLSMAVPLAAGLLITQDFSGLRRGKRAAVLLLRGLEIALLSNSAILCRSLGPLAAIAAALAAMVLLTGLAKKGRLGRSVLVAAACFAVMAASSGGVWDLGDDLSRRAADLEAVAGVVQSPEKDAAKLDGIGSHRGVFWRQAVEYIARHPVFGCGPDNIKAAYAEITGRLELARPHSEPLQYAMSIGLPGLAFYLCALWCLLRLFLKNFRRLEPETIVVFCAVGSYLISSLVGNTKYYSTPYFFMLLGMAWAAARQAGRDKA